MVWSLKDSGGPGYSRTAVGRGHQRTAVGRANVILDNLIARGKAKPMLIVMPPGYGTLEILLPISGGFQAPGIRQRNFDRFRETLLSEVIPRVEAEYLVARDRESRAIAGRSMGGAESLLTGLNTLDRFAWIGAFRFWRTCKRVRQGFSRAGCRCQHETSLALDRLWNR